MPPRRNTDPGSLCREPSPLSADRGATTLPFLPTLATALVVALVSIHCTRTAAPPQAPAVPAATASMMASAAPTATMPMTVDLGEPRAEGADPLPYPVREGRAVHAAEAFARLPLPLLPPAADPAAARARPVHLAAQSAPAPRRPCPAGRCGEPLRPGPAARPAPEAGAARIPTPAPVPAPIQAAERDPFGRDASEKDPAERDPPEGALPFAATAATWVGRVSSLGSGLGREAVALGGAVAGLLDAEP